MKFYANKLALCGVAAFGLTMLAACGDENTTEVTEQTGMDVVAKGGKLPDCTKDNEGDMLYVTDSSAVYYCADGKWATLNGKDGEPGKEGTSTVGTPGTSCTAKTVDNGIEVSCDGKVIGTVKNGEPGTATDGNPGAGCKIDESEGNGIVKVTCGEGKDEKTVTLFKAMCGTESYDPAEKVCFEYVLYGMADGYNADSKVLYDSRNNQLYKVVEICDKDKANCQTWMAENLNYSTNTESETNSWCGGAVTGTTNEGDCSVYGRLYTWAAAKFACPIGWHLPNNVEWETLFKVVDAEYTASLNTDDAEYTISSNTIGIKLRANSSLWTSYSGETNEDFFGFSALPAGDRSNTGTFFGAGFGADFWSSSESEDNSVYYWRIPYNGGNVYRYNVNKDFGFSVRCLKDKPATASN